MKIGLFGNTNNSMFSLAEAINSIGHNAELIVTSKDLLHRPESRVPEFDRSYPDWIMDASDLEEQDYFELGTELDPVIDRLSRCDALVLNYLGPSLLPRLNLPAIVFLTGSDLDYYANPRMVEARTQAWSAEFKASPRGRGHIALLEGFIQRQRRGIQMAVAVRYMQRGLAPEGDRILDELGVSGDRRVFLPSVDQRVKFVPPPRNKPIRVFCGARLTWKLPVEPGRSTLDYKGSDIMIKGLSEFYRATGCRLDIQLVRKGLHVTELEALIAEEGLTDQVTWSNEMSLTEVRNCYAASDIVFDQLADSMVSGVAFEAMATGRPVIGNARQMFEKELGEPAPICQAKTPNEVSMQLDRLVFNLAERERIGMAGRRYSERYLSVYHTAGTILERLGGAFAAPREADNRQADVSK
jgi:glycosyltransferase involved in cell wall biosynthesis